MSAAGLAVVVGVDGGPGSAGAIRYAVAEAARRRAPLRIVHVVPLVFPTWTAPAVTVFPALQELAVEILERAVRVATSLDPDLQVVTRLDHGSRAVALVADARDAQLMVLGRETEHGIGRVMFGATTVAVASRAAVPVAVVPRTWQGDRHGGRVIVGLKDQTNASELLAVAFAEAQARAGSVRAITAWSLPDPYLDRIEVQTQAPEWEAEARRVVEPILDRWRLAFPDVPADFDVRHGSADSVLLDEGKDSDLLVVARRRHATPPHGHLGGVGHRLLLGGTVPILVVPHSGVAPVVEDASPDEVGASQA